MSGRTAFVKHLLQFCPRGDQPPTESETLIDIDARNMRGQTPLIVAITRRNVDCALLLLEAGANPEVTDKDFLTPLHHAVQRGSDVLALALLRAGCTVDAHKKSIPTPLHEAVKNNDYTIVDILLEFNADFQLSTPMRESPLHLAVQSRGEELVGLFMDLGLDRNAKTKTGDTPLMIAARQDSAAICEQLIINGANMDCRDHNQRETALILSVYFGFEENAKVLIAHGANLNITDKRRVVHYW